MSEPKKRVKKSEVSSPKPEVESPMLPFDKLRAGSTQHDKKDIVLKETLTTDHSQLTTEMEVHHHPQLDHKPKPWKEYLLEGLMIFLAVTMGFFAEGLRERIADGNKERQIIVALQKDLQKDTASLSNVIHVYMPAHNKWTDSADLYINTLTLRGNEQRIIKSISNASVWALYSPPEITLNILKNSGIYNLIGNEKLKREILKYNGTINEYSKSVEFLINLQQSADAGETALMDRKLLRRLIDNTYIRYFNIKNSDGFITDAEIPTGALLKTYDKAAFLSFMEKLDSIDFLLNDMKGRYVEILKEDKELLNTLKEEYGLKDE